MYETVCKRGIREFPNKIHFVLQNEYLAKKYRGFLAGHPASATEWIEKGPFAQQIREKRGCPMKKRKSVRES